MYICLCEPVTDRDIRNAVQSGCRSVREVAGRLGCCRDCGRCVRAAREVVEAARVEFHALLTAEDRAAQCAA